MKSKKKGKPFIKILFFIFLLLMCWPFLALIALPLFGVVVALVIGLFKCECEPKLDQIKDTFSVGSAVAPVDIEMQTVAHVMRIPLNYLNTVLKADPRNATLVSDVRLKALLPDFEPRNKQNLSEFHSYPTSKRVIVRFRSYCNYFDQNSDSFGTCWPDKIVQNNVKTEMQPSYGFQPRNERPDTIAYEVPGFTLIGFQEKGDKGFLDEISYEKGSINTDIYLQRNASGDVAAMLLCTRSNVGRSCTLNFSHLDAYWVEVGFATEYRMDAPAILQQSKDLLDSFIITSRMAPSRTGNRIQPFPMTLREQRRLLDEIKKIKNQK